MRIIIGDLWTRTPSATPTPWRPRWMPVVVTAFIALTVILLAAFLASGGVHGGSMWFMLCRSLSVGAFAGGVLTSRPGFRRDWALMFAAICLWGVGDVLGAARLDLGGDSSSYWQLSVVISAMAFVLMTVGVVRLAWRDGMARGSAFGLDTTIYLVSTVVVWWIVIGQELLEHQTQGGAGVVIASLIPLGDGLLLVGASALMSSRTAHAVSSQALILTCLAGLAGDLGFARFVLGHDHQATLPAWIPALWIVQFALAAVAALASGRSPDAQLRHASFRGIYPAMTSMLVPPLVATYAASDGADDFHFHGGTFPVLLMGTLIMSLVMAVRLRLLVGEIERQGSELEHTARTDELTQLPNRRAGDRLLEEALSMAEAGEGSPLSVGILDIDHFKAFNDTYGHQQGDRLLRGASLAWSSVLGSDGVIYRYGGEEFVVILPATTECQAEEVLAELRRATPRGQSFSAGLASRRPGDDGPSLIARADQSLYAAKAAGRSRTIRSA